MTQTVMNHPDDKSININAVATRLVGYNTRMDTTMCTLVHKQFSIEVFHGYNIYDSSFSTFIYYISYLFKIENRMAFDEIVLISN